MARIEVQAWCDFLEVDARDLPDAQMRFYRDTTELQLIMDRLGHSIRTCPDSDLASKWTSITTAMTGLVVDIGVHRRALLREVTK